MTVAEMNARFKADGYRSAGRLRRMCPRCQEDSDLVTSTTIHGKTDYYCNVCAKAWVPPDDEAA